MKNSPESTPQKDVASSLKEFLACKDFYYLNNNKMVNEKIFPKTDTTTTIAQKIGKLTFEYDSCIVKGNRVKDETASSSYSEKIKKAVDVSQKRMEYESSLFKGMNMAIEEGQDNNQVFLQYKTASELVKSMKSVEDGNWKSLLKEISTGKPDAPVTYALSLSGIAIMLILLFIAGFYSVSKKYEEEQEEKK